MPPRAKTSVAQGRYTTRKATLEVEDQIRLRGRGAQKDVALSIGMNEQTFSAKLRGVHTTFTVEEFGRIADHWEAPRGWPWISWGEAEIVDLVLSKNKRA